MTRSVPRFTFLAALLAIALLATLAASSSRAAAAGWSPAPLPPTLQDEEGHPVGSQLTGVSCPTDSLCLAVGSENKLAFSQAPSTGSASWHIVHPAYPGGSGKVCTEGAPGCPEAGGRLQAISCPTQSLCVLASGEGYVDVSTEPTGGAGAWSPTVINEKGTGATHLTAVSCPSVSLCVAVSGIGGSTSGRILTSTDPTSGQWAVAKLDSSIDFRGVSCGTPSLCVAVAHHGRIFTSTEPTGGASAWKEVGTPGGPGDLGGVDCVGTSLCAAGNAGGNVLTTSAPAGNASIWTEVNGGGTVPITGISCFTSGACVAVDNNGDVLTSTNPGVSGSWRIENLVPFQHKAYDAAQNALFGVSCSSTSLCALVGAGGHIFTSTDPFSAPDPSSTAKPKKKAVTRPRTRLLFTDHFWFVTATRRGRVHASFRFNSPSQVRGFECKRDRHRWRRCHSPLDYWAPLGRHVLRVRAIGPTGLRGKPAIKHFRVIRPPRPR